MNNFPLSTVVDGVSSQQQVVVIFFTERGWAKVVMDATVGCGKNNHLVSLDFGFKTNLVIVAFELPHVLVKLFVF